MVLQPGEAFDHRGMFSMLVCFLFMLSFEISVHMYMI
jgi:hypothetical protein